jgi:outer membrane protein assembly factor BamE (lipoprotein component of BamABCDE complex)
MSAVCSVSGCDRAKNIRPGTTEAEVQRVLGRPSWTETDRKEMPKFFFVHEVEPCLSKAVKVLLYHNWIRKDVVVSLDGQGKVLCINRVHMEYQE